MDKLYTVLERRKYNNKTHKEEGPITHYQVLFLRAPGYQSIGTRDFATQEQAEFWIKDNLVEA